MTDKAIDSLVLSSTMLLLSLSIPPSIWAAILSVRRWGMDRESELLLGLGVGTTIRVWLRDEVDACYLALEVYFVE